MVDIEPLLPRSRSLPLVDDFEFSPIQEENALPSFRILHITILLFSGSWGFPCFTVWMLIGIIVGVSFPLLFHHPWTPVIPTIVSCMVAWSVSAFSWRWDSFRQLGTELATLPEPVLESVRTKTSRSLIFWYVLTAAWMVVYVLSGIWLNWLGDGVALGLWKMIFSSCLGPGVPTFLSCFFLDLWVQRRKVLRVLHDLDSLSGEGKRAAVNVLDLRVQRLKNDLAVSSNMWQPVIAPILVVCAAYFVACAAALYGIRFFKGWPSDITACQWAPLMALAICFILACFVWVNSAATKLETFVDKRHDLFGDIASRHLLVNYLSGSYAPRITICGMAFTLENLAAFAGTAGTSTGVGLLKQFS